MRAGTEGNDASQTIEIHRVNDDGTTTPVNNTDGTKISIPANNVGSSVGGRISQTDKDKRKNRVTISLPEGNYRVVVVDSRAGKDGFRSENVGVSDGAPRESKVSTLHDGAGHAIVDRTYPPSSGGGESVSQASQTNGATALGTESTRGAPMGMNGMFSLTASYTFGSTDTSVQQTGNDEVDGKSISTSFFAVRPDIRFYFDDDWGNAYNVANAANVANTGWGLDGCYYGLQGAVNVTPGYNKGLKVRLHPTMGEYDTTLRFRTVGEVTPYLGCTVYRDSNFFLNLQGGPRMQILDYHFKSNEAGWLTEEKGTDVLFGAAFGVEGNFPVADGVVVQTDAWMQAIQPFNQTVTSDFNNWEYDIGTDCQWSWVLRFGVGIQY